MTFACGFSLPVAPSLKGKGKHCGGGRLMRHLSHVLVNPWPLWALEILFSLLSSESVKVEMGA